MVSQTTFSTEPEVDEKPKPMLYDGWGFVPLSDNNSAETFAPAETDKPSEAT